MITHNKRFCVNQRFSCPQTIVFVKFKRISLHQREKIKMVYGNFLGAAIVAIINLILLDTGMFGKKISRTWLVILNIILDALIIVLMAFAFKG